MPMKNDRPSLGFGDELDGLDAAEFAPVKPRMPKPTPETSRKAAEAAGFRSRKPITATTKPQLRRRRTGRNAQLNLKAKPGTIAAFQRIADAKGWGLGAGGSLRACNGLARTGIRYQIAQEAT